MHEVFEHTADLGIRARALTVSELFAESARALMSVIVDDIRQIRPVRERAFRLEGEPIEFLLHDWLTEILYCFETEGLLLSQFEVEVGGGRLSAVCRGEKVDRRRHRLVHEVKAVTYHGLTLERRGNGWLAEVILDI